MPIQVQDIVTKRTTNRKEPPHIILQLKYQIMEQRKERGEKEGEKEVTSDNRQFLQKGLESVKKSNCHPS